jgi:hypothetical protein
VTSRAVIGRTTERFFDSDFGPIIVSAKRGGRQITPNRAETPPKSRPYNPRAGFCDVFKTPVLTTEYLKKEARLKEPLRVRLSLGRVSRRAGLARAAEQSAARENEVSPRPKEAAEE